MNVKDDIWNLFKKIETRGVISHAPEYLLVGLGNPGITYENTHHNTGFMAIDAIASKLGVKINKSKFKAYIGEAMVGNHPVLILKPQTYMNLSGESVGEAAKFYKIPAEKVLVIYDDTTLSLGKMRIRKKGSAGGHNGIKSIIASLGSDEFPRIKIGIGEKPSGWDLADWVLSRYTDDDIKVLNTVFENTLSAAKLIFDGKPEEAMNKYN